VHLSLCTSLGYSRTRFLRTGGQLPFRRGREEQLVTSCRRAVIGSIWLARDQGAFLTRSPTAHVKCQRPQSIAVDRLTPPC